MKIFYQIWQWSFNRTEWVLVSAEETEHQAVEFIKSQPQGNYKIEKIYKRL